MSAIIGVFSCRNCASRRAACESTWFHVTKDFGFDPVFVLSTDCAQPKRDGDYVFVPCPENYPSLPQRTRRLCEWALTLNGWEYLFKCDDDMFVVPARLKAKMPVGADYVGAEWAINCGYASGGGYWLSRRAAEIVAERLTRLTGAEDKLVGETLRAAGIPLQVDNSYFFNAVPSASNDFVLSHILPQECWHQHWPIVDRPGCQIPTSRLGCAKIDPGANT